MFGASFLAVFLCLVFPPWGEFELETAFWRFRAKPSFRRKIRCTQDLSCPHTQSNLMIGTQPLLWDLLEAGCLERVTVK